MSLQQMCLGTAENIHLLICLFKVKPVQTGLCPQRNGRFKKKKKKKKQKGQNNSSSVVKETKIQERKRIVSLAAA